MFGLSNAFQKGISQPGSINGHGGDRLQVKGMDPGQFLGLDSGTGTAHS